MAAFVRGRADLCVFDPLSGRAADHDAGRGAGSVCLCGDALPGGVSAGCRQHLKK